MDGSEEAMLLLRLKDIIVYHCLALLLKSGHLDLV